MTELMDPIGDPRWREFVLRHPRSSVFHTPEWLEALRRTYGFAPVAYTTSRVASVSCGIPFCAVDSWLTGRRLVSLPFSDHCQPLVETGVECDELLEALRDDSHQRGWRYVQLRPLSLEPLGPLERSGFAQEEAQYHYRLDIGPHLDEIFRGVKYDIRKDIRRAERSALRSVVGRDPRMVDAYFGLHVMTRSTQGVPPQPRSWFRNLAACLGEMLDVHLLLQDDTPIAGLITILFRDQLTWKYSASHPVKDRAGMGKSLMWTSIRRAKDRGAVTLDMGRCDPDNGGLARFKERWGGTQAPLRYLRFPPIARGPAGAPWPSRAARSLVPRLPLPVLAAAGRLAYRHFG